MTRRLIGALLMAASTLTPIAAQAQDGGFGGRIMREARGGGDSGEAPRSRPERPAPRQVMQSAPPQQSAPQPRPEWQGGRRGGNADSSRWQGQPRPDGGSVDRTQPRPGMPGGGWRNRGNDQPQGNPPPAWRGGNADGGRWQGQPRPDGGSVDRTQPRPGMPGAVVGNGQRWRDSSSNRWGNNNGAPTPRPDHRGDRPGYDGRGGGFGQQVLRDARRADDRRYDNRRYDDRRYDDRRYGNGRYDNRANWNRGWRDDRRYDWRAYRSRYGDIYRAGRYYSPYNNWSYRRLSIGFSLWPLFYSNQYWINDPYYYRLPVADGPYRWVRYYDDALLVDIYSGQVVDVIYDFFW
jgi:hypothetical protein